MSHKLTKLTVGQSTGGN